MRDHKPVCKVKVGDDHVWALTRYGDVQYAQLNFTIGNPMVTTIRAFGKPRTAGIDFNFEC